MTTHAPTTTPITPTAGRPGHWRGLSLARRNLLHDRVRFMVTLTGIVFSVVLSAVQLGLFVGFNRATSDVIAHSNADIWVMSRGVTYLESAIDFSERRRYQVLSVPGVAAAQAHIVTFGPWSKPGGGEENVMIVGVDTPRAMGGPWNVTAGRVDDLDRPDAVIVDELYLAKLGVRAIGDEAEINGHRAKVAGLTRGIRTFTTAPTIFTTIDRARTFMNYSPDNTLYVLVRVTPGADVASVAAAIEHQVADAVALPTAAFLEKTRAYWMFGTGAGVTVLIAAGLGLLVGLVVVAQTIYAATVDHLREYGTLKAMGASNAYLYRVIVHQAVVSALAGFALAMAVALPVSQLSQQGTTAILLPWPLIGGLFALPVTMCVMASVISINKVMRLEPAMVFRG